MGITPIIGRNSGDGAGVFKHLARGDTFSEPLYNGQPVMIFKGISAGIGMSVGESADAITISGTNTTSGFIDYNDTSTTSSPLALAPDVWTTIPNDGLGSFSLDTYGPDNISELMDVSTGAIDPSELALGDRIIIRNDFIITPSVNGAYIEFRYQLGTGGGIYYLTKQIGSLSNGGGREYPNQFMDYIYMGDANTRDNPITLQIKSSETATLVNNGSVIELIHRISG